MHSCMNLFELGLFFSLVPFDWNITVGESAWALMETGKVFLYQYVPVEGAYCLLPGEPA